MGIRSLLARPFAAYIARQTTKWASQPVRSQQNVFHALIEVGKHTLFGRDHDFESIKNYDDFKRRVPIRDYESFKPYIAKVLEGKPDILWKGKPAYFAKTSGTTSGTKYIPLTNESIPNHINGARNALLSYIHETGNSSFLDGGLIFLSSSPVLGEKAGLPDKKIKPPSRKDEFPVS